MASDVEICNRALQKLGAKRIVSLTDDSKNARACNVAFQPVKLAELRTHRWSFAVKRAALAADSTTPDWGKANAFNLPSDWVVMADDYPEYNSPYRDWQIEGRKIYTNDSDPLYIRYIYSVTDPNEMDALFRESFACKLALELCEEITQSNTKKDAIENDYIRTIREAKKANAIEKISAAPPEDIWITARW